MLAMPTTAQHGYIFCESQLDERAQPSAINLLKCRPATASNANAITDAPPRCGSVAYVVLVKPPGCLLKRFYFLFGSRGSLRDAMPASFIHFNASAESGPGPPALAGVWVFVISTEPIQTKNKQGAWLSWAAAAAAAAQNFRFLTRTVSRKATFVSGGWTAKPSWEY